jgi:acyl carrier protein
VNDLPILEALEALTEISDITDVDPEAKFGSLGFDSLMVIDWISTLEERLNVEFNITDLDTSGLGDLSIRSVVEMLYGRIAAV